MLVVVNVVQRFDKVVTLSLKSFQFAHNTLYFVVCL